MGLGFVLLVWAIIGTFLALIAGAILAAICSFVQKRFGQIRKNWIIAFGIAPFLCGLYCFVAFIAYGIWCEEYRGLDFGTGDTWHIPLANGFELYAIDTFDQVYLVAPNGTQFHEGLRQLGVSGPWIYGELPSSIYFLIDSAANSETKFPTDRDLDDALRVHGVTNPDLLPTESYYQKHRFSGPDSLAAGLILGPPGIGFLILVFLFFRAMRRHSPPPLARSDGVGEDARC
jgi:hypothetical protein